MPRGRAGCFASSATGMTRQFHLIPLFWFLGSVSQEFNRGDCRPCDELTNGPGASGIPGPHRLEVSIIIRRPGSMMFQCEHALVTFYQEDFLGLEDIHCTTRRM